MTHATNSGEISLDEAQRLLDRLCEIDARVVFFPVRHHSPACASLIARWIERYRPAAVLIEGPSDYNPHVDELLLGHELPIAIYSYFRTAVGNVGAYYPFCDYSPEWSALCHGLHVGARVRFIDLPWQEVTAEDSLTHRYSDAELRRSRYSQALCQRMEVEDFDDLWDKLVESHFYLELSDYFRRVHSLCFHIRLWEEEIGAADRRREAFMAEQILETRDSVQGLVLVVTGGFHSSALASRLEHRVCPGLDDPPASPAIGVQEKGIALTPYSYERLDNLTGYNAGMPSPGFYENAWRQRQEGGGFFHEPLLKNLVAELRARGQTFSTADLIAVETAARALAAIRGRPHVWRRDLTDAVTSSLVKDELAYGCNSPFVEAVHSVLRGVRRGRLATGTRMPPLVKDIQQQLAHAGLTLEHGMRTVELDLLNKDDLHRSRLLNRLNVIGIVGYERVDGTDFIGRDRLERLWESWRVRWSPEFDASCIEASRYGTSLADAATACLLESASQHQGAAATAAALLVRAAQSGIETVSTTLLDRLNELIRSEAEFGGAAVALDHLLFLFCFDEAFGTRDLPTIGAITRETFTRCLWLLELLGVSGGQDASLIRGMQALLETFRRAGEPLDLNEDEFTMVMARVEQDSRKPAQVRGAAAGILWTIGAADDNRILADLLGFFDPTDLGDFLAGLFALAREVAQRHPPLVRTIDRLLLEFGSDDFQRALPALRLAFTYFTPREKHYMLKTLFESLGLKEVSPLAKLAVNHETAAEALALEERIFEAITKYGLEEPHG